MFSEHDAVTLPALALEVVPDASGLFPAHVFVDSLVGDVVCDLVSCHCRVLWRVDTSARSLLVVSSLAVNGLRPLLALVGLKTLRIIKG